MLDLLTLKSGLKDRRLKNQISKDKLTSILLNVIFLTLFRSIEISLINLRNPRIALRNLGILTLARNPWIAHRIPELHAHISARYRDLHKATDDHRIAQHDFGNLTLARKGIV